jgi:spoIIIJ-associated protein
LARTVEAHGATVEEATRAALAALGVPADEAVIEVLQEGKRGLFGGTKRALVRASARASETAAGAAAQDDSRAAADDAAGTQDVDGSAPADEEPAGQPQAAGLDDAQEDRVNTDTVPETDQTPVEEVLSPEERMRQLDEEADMAADFVEGLLDLLDLPGDIEIEVQEEQALINVEDVGSGLLIGRRGATLDALQELVRCAVQRQTERRSHVRVDVEGYRSRQIDKLRDKCRDAIAEVRETGEPVRLEPMDAYERKMMHDLVARTGGVTSSSEGTEPKRRVVIHPADD